MNEKGIALLALLACLVAGACSGHTAQAVKNQPCTCAVYPFPPECSSSCRLTEYVVQSVNQNSVVAKTAAPGRVQAMEELRIPINDLHQTEGLKPGSRIQVLSKLENGQWVTKGYQAANGLNSK